MDVSENFAREMLWNGWEKKPGSQRCLKTLKRPRLGENHRTFELVEISMIFFLLKPISTKKTRYTFESVSSILHDDIHLNG